MSEQINTTAEVWKTIPEFPMHSVSNYGRVMRNVPAKAGSFVGILRPQKLQSGYIVYYLKYRGHRKTLLASRLVAQAFLDPDPIRYEVNHKNGIKSDNRPDNLEWATRAENVQHSYSVLGRHVPRGEERPTAKLTHDNVIAIKKLICAGVKLSAIAATFCVSQRAIRSIKDGDNWRHVT